MVYATHGGVQSIAATGRTDMVKEGSFVVMLDRMLSKKSTSLLKGETMGGGDAKGLTVTTN